jgi:hypothetical protein
MKEPIIVQNVTRQKRHQSVTGIASEAEGRIDTLQTWIEIANMFEAVSHGQSAIENPDELTMRRFVFELKEIAVSSHKPRLRSRASDPRRHRALYEVAHIAYDLLAKAAECGYGHNVRLSDIPPTPTSLVLSLDNGGNYSVTGEDLLREEFLPALCSLPPFWKETHNAGRIRRCPVCAKLYYAARKDQPACSKRCVGTWRVRRNRKLTAEEREQRKQRRQKQRTNKMPRLSLAR